MMCKSFTLKLYGEKGMRVKNDKGIFDKIKTSLISTELAEWRKKGLFGVVVFCSLLPFYIIYTSAQSDWQSTLWPLRHFVGMAIVQAIAQVSVAWYILKSKVPMYVIGSFMCMMMFFQVVFCILFIFLSQA